MKTSFFSAGTKFDVTYTTTGSEYEAVVNGLPLHARLLSSREGVFTLVVNGKIIRAWIANDGLRTLVSIEGQVYEFTQAEANKPTSRRSEGSKFEPEIRSPMPGKILEVKVQDGQTVEAGETLILLEAMKMENALVAERKGRVKKIHISPGDLVDLGQLLVELEFVADSQPPA